MKNGPLFIKKKDGAIQNVLRINIEGRAGTMSLLIPSIVWCWKWYQVNGINSRRALCYEPLNVGREDG